MRQMKILITGSNGQLGSELRKIIKAGSSELGSIPDNIRNARLLCVDIDDVNIEDMEAVKAMVDSFAPDVIINCAAFTNVNQCETDRETAFKANAIGPRNLAVAAEQLGAKLIHMSTDYVFEGNGKKPYCEWNVCNPQSVYGYTKWLGEQYVRDFSTKYIIVRTAWLYGYDGNNFVKTIIKTAREKGALKVVDDQRGNPTNAVDLAHHLLKLADTNEYGVYHCTGDGECSWYEFACEIIRLAKIDCAITPCTTEEYPTPAKRPSYSSLENMMLKCTVGDEMRNWKDALAYFTEHLETS